MNNITIKSLIQSNCPILYQAEKKVADYILSHVYGVANYSATELSEESHASEAAIVRTCKKLGHRGYYHLKATLAREVINPGNSYPDNTDFIDIMSPATFLLKKQAEDLIQSTQFFNAEVFESIFKLSANCDTIFFSAAGNLSPLAVHGAYKFGRLGLKIVVHISPEMQINAAYSMGERDLAIGISNSGSTDLMADTLKVVKERGVKSVCITNCIKSPLSKLSTHQFNTAISDKIFLEVFDSARVPAMGVIDTLALLSMHKNKVHCEKYRTCEEFLGSRFKG